MVFTSGGIRAVSPATLAHHTIRYEKAAIHTIEPINVIGNSFLPFGVRVSGNVNHMGINRGATKIYVKRLRAVSGQAMLKGSGSSSISCVC